jgi:hypothetical protein
MCCVDRLNAQPKAVLCNMSLQLGLHSNDNQLTSAEFDSLSPGMLHVCNWRELAEVRFLGKLPMECRRKRRQRSSGEIGTPRGDEALEVAMATLGHVSRTLV